MSAVTKPIALDETLQRVADALEDIAEGGTGGHGVPAGGTEGQVLAKASGTDYDVEWVDQGSSGVFDYDDLTDKPQINGVTLSGNKTSSQLGLLSGEGVADAVDTWLDENITNPDSPPLDRSLTSSSAAAPADMVGALSSEINYLGYVDIGDLVPNTYIHSSSGAEQSYNGWSSTDFIDLTGFNVLTVISPYAGNYNAFYGENKTRVAGLTLVVGENKLTVPSNAKYARFSAETSKMADFKIVNDKTDQETAKAVDGLKNDIGNIEDTLDKDHVKISELPHVTISPSVTLTDKKDWVISNGVAVRQTGTFATDTSNEPIEVSANDIVDITIYSRGDQTLKAIIITDENMNVLQSEDEKTTTYGDLESFSLVMPENAKYILWNNGGRSNPTVFTISRYNKEIVTEDSIADIRNIVPSFVEKSETYNVLGYDVECGNIDNNTGVFTPSTPSDNGFFVTDYLPLDSGEHYSVLNDNSSVWEIWYYDADKKYLNKRAMDYQASGRITSFVVPVGVVYGRYDIRIPSVGLDGTYSGKLKDWAMEVVRTGEKQTGDKYEPYIRLSDESRNEFVFDTRKLYGKTIAIMGDSIAAKTGTLTPEILIHDEDIGVELSAHLTKPDVVAGLTINGHTFTDSEVGTLVTFTPSASDVGKEVGRSSPSASGGSDRWWQLLVGKFNLKYVNASWTGTTMVSYESRGNDLYSRETCAWYDSMINKCGIRVPGTMTRNAPDYIFICRGVNDFSTSHAGNKIVLTEGLFDDPAYTTPSTDEIVVDGATKYGFKEAYALTIQKLRTAYPTATIICCTTTQFKRNNETAYPPNNGHYTLPQLNAAIREVAEFYECRVCDFAKAYTFETLYTYTADNTHPSNAGHREMFHQAMKTLVESIKYTI